MNFQVNIFQHQLSFLVLNIFKLYNLLQQNNIQVDLLINYNCLINVKKVINKWKKKKKLEMGFEYKVYYIKNRIIIDNERYIVKYRIKLIDIVKIYMKNWIMD